jgi:hypothetical protein
MRQISERRRRLVVLCSSVAAMSGLGPVLGRHHPKLELVWIGLMAVGLVFAMTQLAALKREE